MSMPNYPGGPPGGQYPGGYPGQQPGYDPQQQQQQQQTGYGQQAPAQPPQAPAAPAAPKGPSPMSALAAPSNPAAKALWLGVLLVLVSFAFKQIFVDLSLFNAGGALSAEHLQAKQRAELAALESALDSVEQEIEDLERDAPKFDPDSDDDADAAKEKREKHEEKLAKLQKERAKKSKDLEPKRVEIRKEYSQKIRAASRDAQSSTASALGKVKLTLMAKLLFDLLKLVGAAMCVFSGLTIAVDPEQSSGAKAYGAVIGGLAFLSVIVGGLYALLG